MADYKYIIVGGGMTADAAVDGIREIDMNGSIAIIGDDPYPPYERPPLTKKLWKGKPLDSIWLKTADKGVELRLSRKVTRIKPENKTLEDDQGELYSYEKLLLATGGTLRKLPFGDEKTIYFRTLDDYERLRALTGKGLHFGVIGGGFIGSEIAAALAMNGEKVTIVFGGEGIGDRLYPRELYMHLNEFFQRKGIEVIPGFNLTNIVEMAHAYDLMADGKEPIHVDAVIAGIGILPNVELAKSAGIQMGNGIIVDEYLRTNIADIYAAGDVANYYQPLLGKRLRVEHEDNANSMGKQAGRNMAGAREVFDHLSYFYSDLFELGYEAVGELDSHLETYVDWQELFKKGVIYYLAKGRVRGVLLWDVWDAVPAARTLIAEPGPFTTADLKGRIS